MSVNPSPARARPTHASLLEQLSRDMQSDLTDYSTMEGLLERQFEAILQHDSIALVALATDITALAETLERRRRSRVEIVAALLGPARTPLMSELFKLLPAAFSATLPLLWGQLEAVVRTCKERNARNCKLLMEQHEIMQRVLNSEADTYAPL